jgi:hypothetical protein
VGFDSQRLESLDFRSFIEKVLTECSVTEILADQERAAYHLYGCFVAYWARHCEQKRRMNLCMEFRVTTIHDPSTQDNDSIAIQRSVIRGNEPLIRFDTENTLWHR